MPKFGNGNGNVHKTKDQLYKKDIFMQIRQININFQ